MQWPSVTVVCVTFNRREVLREALSKTLVESDYEGELDAIVIDNASADGTAEMVRTEFPGVHLIERTENIGAPAWNAGFAAARGDYIVILDDDCYLPTDGLSRAIVAAREHDADLVSFKVVSTHDPSYVWTEQCPTGLVSFWGCAALVRRHALLDLGGYDPGIFIWGNEMELTLRLYDQGYRHLHFPEIVAHHMKELPDLARVSRDSLEYRLDARNYAYIAGKLLRGQDGVKAWGAHLARRLAASLVWGPGPREIIRWSARGFIEGRRQRTPVRNAALSRFYRENCELYATPWSLLPRPRELVPLLRRDKRGALDSLRAGAVQRRETFYAERANLYPHEPRALSFGSGGPEQNGAPSTNGKAPALGHPERAGHPVDLVL